MLNNPHSRGTALRDSEHRTRLPLAGRVLLADSRRQMRVARGLRLSSLGLQVTTAETGQEALEIAILADSVGYEFHLIMLNMEMPIMDGLEATVLFRHAEYDGPIIAVSERFSPRLEAICTDAGCNGVLHEPVDADALYHLLKRHLPAANPAQRRAA